MSLLKLLSKDSYIMYNKQIARILGVPCAILLGEFCSISNMFVNDEGEFYFTQEKLCNDTTLSERAVRQATAVLVQNKLLTVSRKGNPCRNWYKLHEENILKLIEKDDVDGTSSIKSDTTSSSGFDTSSSIKSDTAVNKNNINTNIKREEYCSTHDLTQEDKDAIMDEYREEHDLNAPNEPVEPQYEDFKTSLVKTYVSMTGKPVSELYQVWGFSNPQKYAEKEKALSIVFKQRRYDWKQCINSAKNHKDIVNKVGSEKWSKFLDILYDFLANGGYGIDSRYKKPIEPEKTQEEMIAEHKKMCAEIFDLKAIFGDEDV